MLWTTTPSLPEAEWSVVSVMEDVTETTMKDLTMNASYFFRVQARNSKGYSPLSQTVRYNVTPGKKGDGHSSEEQDEDSSTDDGKCPSSVE